MRTAILLTCLLALSARAADKPLVILFGDSIRMNYQEAVRAELQDQAMVWSPKENGQHTVFTLGKLGEWLKGRDPQVIHLNVGLHDLFLSAKTGKPRHTLETYAGNLQKIFARLRELTDARLIFALTTAVDEQRQATSKTYGRVVRRNPDVDRYNAKARELALHAGFAVNDLNAFMKRNDPAKLLRDDGIHLTPDGSKIVGKEVALVIRRQLTGVAKP
jgi:hypothetical protein